MIINAQDIIDHSDIVAVVQSRLSDLQRRGANFQACCPFHGEKTPSFTVSPAKGIYKCFGCGAGGNAVRFIMDHDKMSFPDAVVELANIGRMTVEYEKGKNQEEARKAYQEQKATRERYYKANEEYHRHHFTSFEKSFGDKVSIDLDGREYRLETLRTFGVCIVTDMGGIQAPDVEACQVLGLFKKSTKVEGTFYEPFRNRILFPIRNKSGRISGFTARKLNAQENEKAPKYINSPESPIYDKSSLLYGLYHTENEIRKKGFAYVVEGTTDVLSLYDNNIKNAVASCGTSITASHAKSLALKTDRVILLLDGDSAGIKAAKRSIPFFLDEQMEVKVCILPDGSDPDSYIRGMGTDAFKEYVDMNTGDAILWHVIMEYSHGESNHLQVQALELAANYIAKLDSELLQDQYCRDVSKIIGAGLKIVQSKVRDARNKELEGVDELLPDQKQDALKYGICVHHNKYFEAHNNKLSTELTNFIIKPIMLVIGRDTSLRVVEIMNEHGVRFIKDMNSDAFVDWNSFRKELARRGHFLFKPYAKAEHFIRITDKMYAETKNCYPIHTMGYHKEGFWSWGNGISTEGKFIPVDEYGIVEYNDTKYFLPTFSKVNIDYKSDEPEADDDFAADIIYVQKPAVNTVKTWAAMFYKVHGDNGMVGMAYYFAALFRDIIYREVDRTFPHLNLFGPPGSGKSYMAWSISAMYGKARSPFNVTQGTNVGFYRRVAQCRNGIAWLDEWSSKVHPQRVEATKGFYDGSGREKGKMSNDNKTTVTQVNSAVMISGQQLPNEDPALLERCITLFFAPQEITVDMQDASQKLKDIEKTGALSQITSRLQQYREYFKDEFRSAFQEVRQMLTQMADGLEVKGRLINNFSAIAAAFLLISRKEEMPFPFTRLMDFMLERLKDQVNTVRGADEVSGWWSMIEYLADQELIIGDVDYKVTSVTELTYQLPDRTKTKKTFAMPTMILYLKMNKAHKLYLEYSKRQGIDRTLDMGALKHYLKVGDGFIGECFVNLSGKTSRCIAFELDKIGAELHPTYSKDGLEDLPSKAPWDE